MLYRTDLYYTCVISLAKTGSIGVRKSQKTNKFTHEAQIHGYTRIN